MDEPSPHSTGADGTAQQSASSGTSTPQEQPGPAGVAHSRLSLVLEVFGFQMKLLADGLRDVLLSPLSLIALIAGLCLGGDKPRRYFDWLLRFGRRSERWINLFGSENGQSGADDLIRPLQDRVQEEIASRPWLNRAGSELNRQLDQLNASAAQRRDRANTPRSGTDSTDD
jgi:hypothetical protein